MMMNGIAIRQEERLSSAARTGGAAAARLLFVAPDLRRDGEQQRQVELVVNLLRGCEAKVHLISPPAWGFRQLKAKRRFAGELAGVLPEVDVVHLLLTTRESLVPYGVGTILLSRFYNRASVVHYRNREADTALERVGPVQAMLFRSCNGIVVSSNHLVDSLAPYNRRVVVLPDIVDATFLEPRVVETVQPRMIASGPLQRNSNFGCLLKAFALVKQKYPRAELTIVGDGPLRHDIQKGAWGFGTNGVTFVGWVSAERWWRLLHSADLYVSTSVAEVLPVSLLDALATGLPVVTAAVGGVPSLVTDGRNGLLVDINNHGAVADRIITLIEKPSLAKALSLSARNSVSNHLWESACQEWLPFLTQMA